jgi:hypothetical protein
MNKEELNYIKKRLLEQKLTDEPTPGLKRWVKGWNNGISHSMKLIDEIIDELSKTESISPSEVKVCPFLSTGNIIARCNNGKLTIYDPNNPKIIGKCHAWVKETTSYSYIDDCGYEHIVIGEGGRKVPGYCRRM